MLKQSQLTLTKIVQKQKNIPKPRHNAICVTHAEVSMIQDATLNNNKAIFPLTVFEKKKVFA